METLILFIFALAIFVFALQLSFYPKPYLVALSLLGSALFIYFMHSRAIEQSYGLFRQYLADDSIMSDFVVLLIIDALAGLLLAIFMLRRHYGETGRKLSRYLVYWPGFILFPALFYGSSIGFLNIPGFSFQLLAVLLALALPLSVFGFASFFKQFIPEFNLRAELKFMLHLVQLICGIVLSIIYLKVPVQHVPVSQTLPWPLALGILSFTLCLILLGLGLYHFKINRFVKKYSWKK